MSDKREAILGAMLDLVAECGLQNAPMSLVAKRSGVSAGVIYHYFDSKEELLRALYVQVKKESSVAVNAAAVADLPPPEAFERMWMNAYRYFAENRKKAQFIEQFEGMPGYKTPAMEALLGEDSHHAALRSRFHSGAARFPLKDLPLSIINELSFIVASRLAVRLAPLDEKMQKEVARSCWQAITV